MNKIKCQGEQYTLGKKLDLLFNDINYRFISKKKYINNISILEHPSNNFINCLDKTNNCNNILNYNQINVLNKIKEDFSQNKEDIKQFKLYLGSKKYIIEKNNSHLKKMLNFLKNKKKSSFIKDYINSTDSDYLKNRDTIFSFADNVFITKIIAKIIVNFIEETYKPTINSLDKNNMSFILMKKSIDKLLQNKRYLCKTLICFLEEIIEDNNKYNLVQEGKNLIKLSCPKTKILFKNFFIKKFDIKIKTHFTKKIKILLETHLNYWLYFYLSFDDSLFKLTTNKNKLQQNSQSIDFNSKIYKNNIQLKKIFNVYKSRKTPYIDLINNTSRFSRLKKLLSNLDNTTNELDVIEIFIKIILQYFSFNERSEQQKIIDLCNYVTLSCSNFIIFEAMLDNWKYSDLDIKFNKEFDKSFITNKIQFQNNFGKEYTIIYDELIPILKENHPTLFNTTSSTIVQNIKTQSNNLQLNDKNDIQNSNNIYIEQKIASKYSQLKDIIKLIYNYPITQNLVLIILKKCLLTMKEQISIFLIIYITIVEKKKYLDLLVKCIHFYKFKISTIISAYKRNNYIILLPVLNEFFRANNTEINIFIELVNKLIKNIIIIQENKSQYIKKLKEQNSETKEVLDEYSQDLKKFSIGFCLHRFITKLTSFIDIFEKTSTTTSPRV